MIAHLLQDWVTLRGTTATTAIRQTEVDWLTLDGFRDASVWVQVSEADPDLLFSLNLETSPTLDEDLFQTLTATALEDVGVWFGVSRARFTTDAPLARVLRWALLVGAPTSNWAVTFRVFVCLNPITSGATVLRGGEPLGAELVPGGL